MRDLKDLKRGGDEEGAGPKKKPPYLLIGLLSVLVFFALVLLFRKKGESPTVTASQTPPPVSQIAPAPPVPKEPAEKEEPLIQDPAVKPGEMRFDSKPEPFPTAPPPPNNAPASSITPQSTPAPKDDLTFFKTLKDKKEKEIALQPKPMKPLKKENRVKKQAEPVQVSVPPRSAGSSGPYTIQVASFAERKGAEALSQKLKRKGYQAYVATGEVPQKGIRYRVRIGHYPNRAEAQKAAERIHDAEKLSFLVTSDLGK